MSEVKLKGNPIKTNGELPKKGEKAPDFKLTKSDLSHAELNDYKGKRILMNIFPSVDTGVCAQSVREFNKKASAIENTTVLCISKDLPFAFKRFCAAEGIENVESLSDFADGNFGKNYGVEMVDGPMANLLSRAVVVIDEEGKVIYNEQVTEITDGPDYDAAMAVLK